MNWNSLTLIQKFGLALVIVNVVGGSTTQLTTLFGQSGTAVIVAAATIISGILGGFVTFFGGMGNQLNNVQNMPGVDNVLINAKADPTTAKMALDPANDKISPLPDAQVTLAKIAKR